MVKKKKELNKIYSLISIYFNLESLKEIVDLEKSDIGTASSGITFSMRSNSLDTDIIVHVLKLSNGTLNLTYSLSDFKPLPEKEVEFFMVKLKKALSVSYIEINDEFYESNAFTLTGVEKVYSFYEKLEIKGFLISPTFAKIRTKICNI